MNTFRKWPGTEPPDHHVYQIHFLSKEALLHYREAAQHYKFLLDRAWEKVQSHQKLLALLDEEQRKNLPIGIEREKIERVIAHLSHLIDQAEEQGGSVHFVEVSHEWVRLIKSLCRLYEEHLRGELDRLKNDREMPAVVTSSLRLRLAQLAEKTSMGVFADATPIPLVIEDWIAPQKPEPSGVSGVWAAPASGGPSPEEPEKAPSTTDAGPALPVLNSTLRERTVDLFTTFEARADEERYDTVLRETGAVVEDRLRNACGAPPEKVGVDLASHAFGGSSPRIQLSTNTAEQEGVHHLFRGFFGWVRNPAGHRLLGKVSKERVLQVLAFADYLLGLRGEAQAREGTGAP